MKSLGIACTVTLVLFLTSPSLCASNWDSVCDSIAGALGDCYDGTLTREDIEDAFVEGKLSSMTPEQAENFGELCEMAGRASLRGLTRGEIVHFFGGVCRVANDFLAVSQEAEVSRPDSQIEYSLHLHSMASSIRSP